MTYFLWIGGRLRAETGRSGLMQPSRTITPAIATSSDRPLGATTAAVEVRWPLNAESGDLILADEVLPIALTSPELVTGFRGPTAV